MTSSCRTMGARKEGLPSGRPSPPSPSERRVSSQGWKRLGRECPVPLCSEAPGLHPGAPRHVGDRDGGAGEGAAPVKEVTTRGAPQQRTSRQGRPEAGGGARARRAWGLQHGLTSQYTWSLCHWEFAGAPGRAAAGRVLAVAAENVWGPRLPPWGRSAPRVTGHRGAGREARGQWAAQARRTCICQAPVACRALCKALGKHCPPE